MEMNELFLGLQAATMPAETLVTLTTEVRILAITPGMADSLRESETFRQHRELLTKSGLPKEGLDVAELLQNILVLILISHIKRT